MKVCVCEDHDTQREYILNLVIEWAKKNSIALDLKQYSSSEQFLFNEEDDYPFDVLLLDIEMKGISGIELARKLREVKNTGSIIFLTGVADYVFEGYEVSALGYLMKPIDVDQLYSLLDKTIQKKKKSYILINNTRVETDNIIFLKSDSHYISIITLDGEIDQINTLKAMERMLDSSVFVRCHKSYIVNIKHIEKIEKGQAFMSNQMLIPISRNYRKEVQKAFVQLYRVWKNA